MQSYKDLQDTSIIKIGIIEDYKLSRLALKYNLNEYKNIKVVFDTQNAESGLELIKTNIQNDNQPDIILMDLGLAGMNGYEATKKIKELYNNKIKVIILTAYNNQENIINAINNKVDAYCLKDITIKKLIEVIINVFNGMYCFDSNAVENYRKNEFNNIFNIISSPIYNTSLIY